MDYMSFEQWRKLSGVAAIYFEYIKLDGSIRPAYGTRNVVIGKYLGYPEIENQPVHLSPYSYFDFGKREWRCFSPRCNDDILVFDNEDEYNEQHG